MNNDENQSNYWKPDETPTPIESVENIAQPAIEQEALNNEEELLESPRISETNNITTPVDWMAPEYFVGQKGKLWYLILAIVAIIFILISIFVFQSYTFAVLVLVMAISLVVYARRPPQEIKYTLSVKQGLYIGDKLYNLQDYKSFSLVQGVDHNSIELIPIKRFSPGVLVYFPSEVGEKIIDILASRLPMEESKPDLMDKIIKKLNI